jgi:hypothetical protein
LARMKVSLSKPGSCWSRGSNCSPSTSGIAQPVPSSQGVVCRTCRGPAPARSTRSCAGHDHCPNSVWGVGSARPARPVLGDEGLLEGAAPDGAGGEQTAMKEEGVNGPPRASLAGAVAREGVATTVVVNKVVLSRRRRTTGRGHPAEDGRFCWFPNMRWAGLIQWAGV